MKIDKNEVYMTVELAMIDPSYSGGLCEITITPKAFIEEEDDLVSLGLLTAYVCDCNKSSVWDFLDEEADTHAQGYLARLSKEPENDLEEIQPDEYLIGKPDYCVAIPRIDTIEKYRSNGIGQLMIEALSDAVNGLMFMHNLDTFSTYDIVAIPDHGNLGKLDNFYSKKCEFMKLTSKDYDGDESVNYARRYHFIREKN